MKKLLISILAAAAIMPAMAAPDLTWLNPVHNFGAFKEDVGPVTCVFKAVNTGDEPVVVIDARANCGCPRPPFTREPVAPGDTLSVSVAYDPAGRPGRFSKQVKVTTNTAAKSYILGVRGTVIGSSGTLRSRYPDEVGPYRVSNHIAPFGETTKGHILAAAINIYNPTADTIQPEVKDVPGFINTMFRPVTIPPGEQGILSMTAYTDRTPLYGIIEDSLTIVPNAKLPEHSISVATVMIVNEDFTKLTEKQLADAPVTKPSLTTLDFGVIDPTSIEPLKMTFTIANNGHETMQVRRLYSPDRALAIKASAMKAKPGKKITVTVSLIPSMLSPGQLAEGILNSRITLITNDPANPTQTIRVVGQIK